MFIREEDTSYEKFVQCNHLFKKEKEPRYDTHSYDVNSIAAKKSCGLKPVDNRDLEDCHTTELHLSINFMPSSFPRFKSLRVLIISVWNINIDNHVDAYFSNLQVLEINSKKRGLQKLTSSLIDASSATLKSLESIFVPEIALCKSLETIQLHF